jgi:hypothetical protein
MKEFGEQVNVALDHQENKRVVVIDSVQRPSKQGSTQSTLGLFHSDDTEPELVHLQPGFDFISPDAVVVLIWVQRDRGYRGIHLEHLHQGQCTVGLSCFRHRHIGNRTSGSSTSASMRKVKTIKCGVIRQRLAHDIPAFIGDLNSSKIQCFDAQVSGKSPK